jgi:hypothetical protein
MLDGDFRLADLAGPSSPIEPLVPVPTAVEIVTVC